MINKATVLFLLAILAFGLLPRSTSAASTTAVDGRRTALHALLAPVVPSVQVCGVSVQAMLTALAGQKDGSATTLDLRVATKTAVASCQRTTVALHRFGASRLAIQRSLKAPLANSITVADLIWQMRRLITAFTSMADSLQRADLNWISAYGAVMQQGAIGKDAATRLNTDMAAIHKDWHFTGSI